MRYYSTYQSQFIEMFGGIQNDSKWPLKSLGELCEMVNGYAFKSTKYSESGYSIIRIANVQKGSIDDSDKVYYSEQHKDEFSDSILKEGDILISLTGNVGRAGVIYNKHLPAALNQRVQGLRIKNASELNHQYLFSLLNLDSFEELCIKNASGSAQLNLSTVWLRNCKIVCPRIEEQTKFALIAHQADKSKFSSLKSQFIEMFNEKGYPLAMIKSFADVSTGGTPSKANPEYWNGDKPWVSAEDMKNKYVYDTLEKVTEAGYAMCKIIPVDTLMYVCRGSIGVMAINKIECATNQSICRAKCHDNVCNVEFLYHALMYQRDNIKKMGTGTSFKSLNQTSFSELKIELPPYNEQMKFVSIAQQADKSKLILLQRMESINFIN